MSSVQNNKQPLPKNRNTTDFVNYTQASQNKKWFLIDAEGITLGKLAVYVARILKGKHKASYTAHIDAGDNVIIINADKVALTGHKEITKKYYRHTGPIGGIKCRNVKMIRNGKDPTFLIQNAVKGMVGRNCPMSRKRLKNLYLYVGSEHKHSAQNPTVIDFVSTHKKHSKKS